MVRSPTAPSVMSTGTTETSAPPAERASQSAPPCDVLLIEDDPGVPAAPVGPPGVRIHSLGRFYVEHGGQIRLAEGGRARKAATLFKYLLTHQERTVPTSEVLRLFWPDAPKDLAATDLRSLLYQLR